MDAKLELAASQHVLLMNNEARITTDKPCHECGADAGQFHTVGCKQETCSVCDRTVRVCGCAYD